MRENDGEGRKHSFSFKSNFCVRISKFLQQRINQNSQGAGMKLKVAVSLILSVLTIKSFPISEFSCYEV